MKKWYKSKMLWLNVIGIAVIIIQAEYGYVISLEHQGLILGFINLLLRLITKEGLE